MIVPQGLPTPPDQVFQLATPAHMLNKLHWEIHTLRSALSNEPKLQGHTHAPSYCAFNCAVTAWHLTDWTWLASLPDQRANILACLSFESSGRVDDDLKRFQAALMNMSRVLHICQQIATGSKHMAIRRPDPEVRVEMRWQEPSPAANDPRTGYHYRIVVSDRGVERPAVDVFEEAFKVWERLLGDWWFIEGSPIVGPGR
jgi:hypothetical protein